EPGLVHRALDGVGDQGRGEVALERRPAGMPGQRRGEDVVVALELTEHELPDPPGAGEAVQADERPPGPAAMRGSEERVHAGNASQIAPPSRDLHRMTTLDSIPLSNGCHVTLHRTLRIPDDGRDHPLPPSLGRMAVHAAGPGELV